MLSLDAVDSNGNTSRQAALITINSQYKMGNFNLDFDDLTVGVGGIPITIKRTYDSLKSNISSDFGYGWNMSYIPVSLRDDTGYSLAGDWFDSLYSDAGFKNGTKITVTMPDGKTSIFRVNAVKGNRFLPYYNINFVNESGTGATLGLDRTVSLLMGSDGILTDTARASFHPASSWTPANYVLTTTDGIKYYVGSNNGKCYQATDAKKNKIEITKNGIRSYSGTLLVGEVTFQRDSHGRIISISNTNGDNVTYEYDIKGDLTNVNNSTLTSGRVELNYIDDSKAPLHYLKSVVDIRGVELLGVEYDFMNGRIMGITGPDGSSSSIGFTKSVGPGLNVETVTDQLGRTSETVVDKDGNTVRNLVYIPDPTDPGNLAKLTYQIVIQEFDIKGNCLGTSRTFQVTELELLALGKNQYNFVPPDLFWEARATYDAKNNMLTSTDAYGKVTKYTYDSAGYLLTTTDPLGRISTNKYDSYGKCLESTDFSGNKIVYTYDSGGRLASYKTVKPDGTEETQTFEYNSQNKMTKIVDPKGNVTRYAYNKKGWKIYTVIEMKDIQDPLITHTIMTFSEYDEAGNETKNWKEINGVEISHQENRYDEIGQIIGSTDKYGLTTEYIYDINSREIETRQQVKDSNGQLAYLVTRMVYDTAGQLIWEQDEHLEADPVNNPQAAEATYISYDTLGRESRLERRANVLIKVSGSGYNIKTVVAATGNVISYTIQGYDQHNREAWSENEQGVKTVNFYTKEGSISHTMVDMDGDLSTANDQFITQKVVYDAYGQKIQTITDRDGDLATTNDQIPMSCEYDNHGRVMKVTYADATFTAYTYDAVGRKTSETDQMGRRTYYEYDPAGRLMAVIMPQAKHPISEQMVHVRYEYGYNAAGQQISLKDNIFQTNPLSSATIDYSGARETRFEYDWQGHQISRTLPDGSTEYFSYDLQGRQTKHISFEGRVTAFEYDSLNRLSRNIFFNNATDQGLGWAAKTINYTYDLLSRMVKEVDSANGISSTSYNTKNQISQVSSPQGVINYEYDTMTGQINRTWTGDNSAQPITDVRNTYDKLDRLERISIQAREGAILSTPETARYVYDIIGNLDMIIQANGVIADYEYDQFNRLKKLTHYAPDATPEDLSNNVMLQHYVYDYYNDGQKSRETFTDAQGQIHTWDWIYDQLGRLTKETHDNKNNSLDYSTEYVYDLVGNRLEKREDLGNNGTIDKVTQGLFDQNDRLLSETEKVNGQAVKRTNYIYRQTEQVAKTVINLINSQTEAQTSMEYNAQGRLSKITIDSYTNGLKTKSIIQEYVYNAEGMKISQVEKVDANADGVIDNQSTTNYLNEALNHTGYAQVLEERRVENGQVVKTTTYTIGHDVLSQFNSVNGYLALMADGHGSTRGVANSLGQVVQEYSYDAYGNAIGFVPKNALTNLLYSGEQYNAVSNLQYLRARWYNPESGRFNRLDPYFGNHENPLSFHKYAYAHMNPVMNSDPSGLFSLAEMMTSLQISANISMRLFSKAFLPIMINTLIIAFTNVRLSLLQDNLYQLANTINQEFNHIPGYWLLSDRINKFGDSTGKFLQSFCIKSTMNIALAVYIKNSAYPQTTLLISASNAYKSITGMYAAALKVTDSINDVFTTFGIPLKVAKMAGTSVPRTLAAAVGVLTGYADPAAWIDDFRQGLINYKYDNYSNASTHFGGLIKKIATTMFGLFGLKYTGG